jgi:hypothetical protein
MKLKDLVLSAVTLCVVGWTGPVLEAQAQRQEPSFGERTHAKPAVLTLPALPALDPPLVWNRSVLTPGLTAPSQAQTTARTCRRGRRAWIGALIGAAAATPLAALAHERWENEAANGAAAAATTVTLGAAAGAFIGLSTCH